MDRTRHNRAPEQLAELDALMNPAGIDTSALLTMLGLIAAVWALVPSTSRLSFRLSLSVLDWMGIWVVLLIIHGFSFEPVLTSFGFPILGPWLWGFDEGATQYLLFLMLAAFVYWRARRTTLTRWNLGLFDDLTTSLLHSGKLEDLAELLVRHLDSALDLAEPNTVRSRIADAIRPAHPGFNAILLDDGSLSPGVDTATNWFARQWVGVRESLADLLGPSQKVQRRASIVLRRLLSSRPLCRHMAIAHPYLCLKVMQRATRLDDRFQDEFFDALLADESSIIYSEVKNNENFAGGGHRLALPEENRLLRFYCANVEVASRLGVYRSLGEAVLTRIDADEVLEKKLNGRLLTFVEVGKYRDPVYVGTWFFRIMVLEGLHQRVADHLWLHYMPFFAERLVDRARDLRGDDENYEFPTPLAYLLYQVVDTTTVWVREALVLTQPGMAVQRDHRDGDHVFISFEAAGAIGRVMRPILMASNLPERFKIATLCIVLTALRDVEQHEHLAPLAGVLRSRLIEPYKFSETVAYLGVLKVYFQAQDHVLRADLDRFKADLEAALGNR